MMPRGLTSSEQLDTQYIAMPSENKGCRLVTDQRRVKPAKIKLQTSHIFHYYFLGWQQKMPWAIHFL